MSATDTQPWTQEMVIVHRVFRREFRVMAVQIPKVRPGDAARVKLLADHVGFGLTMLDHHHSGEDALVWPKLRERCTVEADLVKRMEDQHHQVHGILTRAVAELAAWRSAPSAATAEPLSHSLVELSDALDEHLGEEEAKILPLIEEHMTVAEWDEVGARALGSIPPPKRLFALGLLMEEATPAEEQRFLLHVPAVPRAIYKVIGRGQYRKSVARLRGLS
jgi:hemerythrin-like domain-containing protein